MAIPRDEAELFEALARRIGGIDEGIIESVRETVVPLEKLADAIGNERICFESSKRNLNTFDPSKSSNSLTANLRFFPSIYTLVQQFVFKTISAYERISLIYNECVRDKLSSSGDNAAAPKAQSMGLAQQVQAVNYIDSLFKLSTQQFLMVVETFPRILEAVNKQAANYNDYLRDRFVKEDDNNDGRDSQRMMVIDPNEQERRGRYVKVELIEGNPVLTDVLLELAGSLPSYRERKIRTGRKEQKVREVSSFAVYSTAEKLIALENFAKLAITEQI